MKLLLDYRFRNEVVANPDGSFPIQLTGTTIATGPVDSQLGRLEGAIDLGASGGGVVNLEGLSPDLVQFCVRIVAQAYGPVAARQNLVESSWLPFALFLDPGSHAQEFIAAASVMPAAHGWYAATARFNRSLSPATWYTIDLAYDVDTVAIFIDGVIAAVQAFPDGSISELAGRELFIGTWVDGVRWHFDGKVAALQLWAGIPEELERQLDERRSYPEWFISHKRVDALQNNLNLGSPTAAIVFDAEAGAHLQSHEWGAIMYHDGTASALEMHGAIHGFYAAYGQRAELGFLTSDEGDASSHVDGRKNTFSKGAIYWSQETGALPVTDRIFLSYEHIEGVNIIGFPVSVVNSVPGGLEQPFQYGRMYHRAAMLTAYEVHGAILSRYLETGGLQRWGFPVTDEDDVRRDGGEVIGKVSRFEVCTFYWSGRTGAFEVHGDIRNHYESLRGPAGELGFPTSDELDIPDESGPGRFNTFENGSLCWYGSRNTTIHVRSFRIYLGRIETRESEGFGMGQNDIYLREVRVDVGGQTIYKERVPSRGDWGGNNSVNVDLTVPTIIVPNTAATVTFTVDVWEADSLTGGGDDHLGKYTKVLGAANAWGMRENQGVFNSGSFSKIRNIAWSVKPVVDVFALTELEKFWGVRNQGTPKIDYFKYAAAFRDVDSESEWYDPGDHLKNLFYNLVVDTLADDGNCFGMSLEAIYARNDRSVFGPPLNRFRDWNFLERQFNIKHCYQVGASAIWWFVGQVLSGNTHDPTDVFHKTQGAFWRGRHPVLCLAQNYDFSGRPHVVLPVRWDNSVKPWRIDIWDSNFSDPKEPDYGLTTLQIDPDQNTFKYEGRAIYEGDAWTSGRLYYFPFDVLNRRPRTPVWDAIMLLLRGTMVILGEDARTESITDPAGNDLDAHGDRARRMLQDGIRPEECFVSYKGFDGADSIIAGELLLQMDGQSTVATALNVKSDPRLIACLSIRDLLADRALRPLARELAKQPEVRDAIADRMVAHVLADRAVTNQLEAPALQVLQAAAAAKQGDFVHTIAGVREGSLNYVTKHGLNHMQLLGSLAESEHNKIRIRDIATSTWSVAISGDRDKLMKMIFESKLGTGGDNVRIIVEELPMTEVDGLEMNLRSGLGGIDILAGGGRTELPMTIQSRISGRNVERQFLLPLEAGVRVRLANVLSDGALSVGRIERLFGPISGIRVIRPR